MVDVLNESVIGEFGERLGIQNLQFTAENQLDLEVAETDRLQIQLTDGVLLVCYAVAYHLRTELAFMERLLMLTHPDNEHRYPLQVGYIGDQYVVFITRLLASEVNADEMVDVFDFLWELKQNYITV